MRLLDSTEWLGQLPAEKPTYDYAKMIPEPEVSLRYIHVRHMADAGLPDYLDEVLADADVFVRESIGHPPDTEKLFNKAARGKLEAYRTLQSRGAILAPSPEAYEYGARVLRALYDSNVTVILPDYGRGINFDRMHKAMQDPDFRNSFPVLKHREQFVMQNVCSAIRKLRQTSSRFEGRPIRVVMPYGAVHIGMVDGFRLAADEHQVDMQVTQEFEESLESIERFPPNRVLIDGLVSYQRWLRGVEQSSA